MATVTLKGSPVTTIGSLPAVGSPAPAFTLVGADLADVNRTPGVITILNIFPSIDTPTCATSVRRFNAEAATLPGVTVLCVSADLPFAQKRFCGAEGITNVAAVSSFRSTFGADYGLTFTDSKLKGLLARAVVVIGADGLVKHTELVAEIANEPNYGAAMAAAT